MILHTTEPLIQIHVDNTELKDTVTASKLDNVPRKYKGTGTKMLISEKKIQEICFGTYY